MLKKFMIEKIDHEIISKTAGRIVFHLVDENGNCRTVGGETYINENEEPQGVTSESIRELPLIESLFSNRNDKIVEIEFDHFNKVFDRDNDRTINQAAHQAVIEMKKQEKLSNRITSFFKR